MTLGELLKDIQEHLASNPDDANLKAGYFEENHYGGNTFVETEGLRTHSYTEYVSPLGYVRKTVASI